MSPNSPTVKIMVMGRILEIIYKGQCLNTGGTKAGIGLPAATINDELNNGSKPKVGCLRSGVKPGYSNSLLREMRRRGILKCGDKLNGQRLWRIAPGASTLDIWRK